MNMLAALLVAIAFVAAAALVVPACRRTALGRWHPAVAWLALELVFFGVGSVVIAVEGDGEVALYVSGAVLAFAAAVLASDHVARGRAGTLAAPLPVLDAPDPAPVRPVIAAILVAIGVLAIAPILLRVGIPFLVPDITAARVEIAGPVVQLLRVAIPGAVLAAIVVFLRTRSRTAGWIAVALLAVGLLFDIALASRYLAVELVAAGVLAAGLAGARLPRAAVIAVGATAVLVFGGIQVLRAYEQAEGHEVMFGVSRTVERLFIIQPRTLEALQAEIPAHQPFFGGLTWLREFGPALGRPDIPNLGYWIYPRLFPGQEPPGYAAPGLIGEAWANFGAAGILLFAGLGVAVERAAALVAQRRLATADIAAAALLVLFIARTHALGLNGLAVLVVLVLAWRLFVGRPAGLVDDLVATLRWRT
jgi:hypothetical protein